MNPTMSESPMSEADIATALRITPLFYDAVLEPNRWNDVLRVLCEWFAPARGVSLNLYRLSENRIYASFAHGFSDEENEIYLSFTDHFNGDPRNRAIAQCPNKPFRCRDVATTEEVHASPIYRQVLHRLNVENMIAIHLRVEKLDEMLSCGVMRGRGDPDFTNYEVAKFQLLVPHLRRAAEVYARLITAEEKSRKLEKAFDETSLATLFVDHIANVVHANEAAQQVLGDGLTLFLKNNILYHQDTQTTVDLHACIRDVASKRGIGTRARVQHIELPRSHAVPLQATICSLATEPSNDLGWISSQIRAAVFITDPLKSYESNVEKLQRSFGLTAAEAEVLSAIASGSSTKEIAEETTRSVETVRRHLKNVMAKTGTNRQAELVRLVLSMSPGVDT